MEAKTISKEERSQWWSIIRETYPTVLKPIVKNNILDPENMGRQYAALVVLIYACEITVDNKQESMIGWEENYLHEIMMDEMVCYRYLLKWTLGHGDLDKLDEDNLIKKEWNDFYQRNKKEVDEYTKKVHLGFSKYMIQLRKKYQLVEHPVFETVDAINKVAEKVRTKKN